MAKDPRLVEDRHSAGKQIKEVYVTPDCSDVIRPVQPERNLEKRFAKYFNANESLCKNKDWVCICYCQNSNGSFSQKKGEDTFDTTVHRYGKFLRLSLIAYRR